MWIKGFAREKSRMISARAFENHVDAAIAQKTFDRDRFFARPASDSAVSYPRPPRTRIASSALRQVVAHFAHRRFDP
jgi:hypothetical protein